MAALLPPELIIIILRHLYDAEREVYMKCMILCKDWYTLSLPISCRDILLRDYPPNTNIQKFVHQAGEDQLNLVRSITADMLTPVNFDIQFQLLEDFIVRMTNMPSLESFSLKLYLSGLFVGLDVHERLNAVLLSIPPTIRFLELRAFEIHRIETREDDQHKCMALASMIPQLKSLRLNDMRVCFRIFSEIKTICPYLEEIVIVIGNTTARNDCRHNERKRGNGPDNDIEDVLAAARDIVDRGLMPEIKKFVAVGFKYWVPIHDRKRNQILYEANVLKTEVMSYPAAMLERDEWWFRYKKPDTGTYVDLIADPGRMMDFIANSSWEEHHDMTRIPRNLGQRRNHCGLRDPGWFEESVAAAKKWRLDNQPSARLFFWEDRAGRPLTHPQKSCELIVPRHIKREQTLEEKDLDPNSELAKEEKSLWWIDW